jgi:hypothetical protein
MKTSIKILFFAGILGISPLFGSNATPTNATEAVFYASGMVSAKTEVEDEAYAERRENGTFVYSFRSMANMNRGIAYLFSRYPDSRVFMFYLLGRADLFDQLADLAGEPR